MADVDFGHIINQDELIVPDVYSVGTNIELVTLDGAAVKVHTLATGLHLVDEAGIDAEVSHLLGAGLTIVNHGGRTAAQIEAAIINAAKRLNSALREPGDRLGSGVTAATNDEASTPTATALVPGSWTPT